MSTQTSYNNQDMESKTLSTQVKEEDEEYHVDLNQRITLPKRQSQNSQIVKLKISMPKIILVDSDHNEMNAQNISFNVKSSEDDHQANQEVHKVEHFSPETNLASQLEPIEITPITLPLYRRHSATGNLSYPYNHLNSSITPPENRSSLLLDSEREAASEALRSRRIICGNRTSDVKKRDSHLRVTSQPQNEEVNIFNLCQTDMLRLSSNQKQGLYNKTPLRTISPNYRTTSVRQFLRHEAADSRVSNQRVENQQFCHSVESQSKKTSQNTIPVERYNIDDAVDGGLRITHQDRSKAQTNTQGETVKAKIMFFESPQTPQRIFTHDELITTVPPKIVQKTTKKLLDMKDCKTKEDSIEYPPKPTQNNSSNFTPQKSTQNYTEETNYSEIVKDIVLDTYRDVLQNFMEKSLRRRKSRECRDSGNNSISDGVCSDSDIEMFHPLNVSNSTSCEDVNRTYTIFSTEEETLTSENQAEEYNEQAFLELALGAELISSTSSMNSVSSVPTNSFTSEEDKSVGTSQLSQLISVDFYSSIDRLKKNRQSIATYSSFPEFVGEMAVQNVSISMEHERSYEESILKDDNDEKQILMQELDRASSIVVQVSKALDLCNQMEKFNASIEKIEAEALLLHASIQKEVLTEELTKPKHTAIEAVKIGYVRLSNIKIILTWTPENFSKYTRFFVCIFRCGRSVFSSGLLQSNNKSELEIRKSFYFEQLPDDFKITIQIYSMYAKVCENEHNNSKDCSKTFHNIKRIFSPRRNSDSFSETYCSRKSSFILYGDAMIARSSLKRKEYKIRNVYPRIPLAESLICDTDTILKFDNFKTGFLTVGEHCGGVLIWNRQWCVFEATELKFWDYPGRENEVAPNKSIDLSRCLLDNIENADPSLCARPRSIYLEIDHSSSDEERHSKSIYLSADTQQELNAWKVELNYIVKTLLEWDCMKAYFRR